MRKPLVGIIMGSKSDLTIMSESAEILEALFIPFEITIASAHRTPERTSRYSASAEKRGLKVIIAGAGGAAHLPGVIASFTTLPVIGVPIKSSNSIDGWDSMLSILQMPAGIPVATVALNGAQNAGILAAEIIALSDKKVSTRLKKFRVKLRNKVLNGAAELEKDGYKKSLQKKIN